MYRYIIKFKILKTNIEKEFLIFNEVELNEEQLNDLAHLRINKLSRYLEIDSSNDYKILSIGVI